MRYMQKFRFYSEFLVGKEFDNSLMPEEAVQTAEESGSTPAEEQVDSDQVSYQAVEKEGTVTAIWEMQGQRHLRTIDPRSNEGKQILALFETAG